MCTHPGVDAQDDDRVGPLAADVGARAERLGVVVALDERPGVGAHEQPVLGLTGVVGVLDGEDVLGEVDAGQLPEPVPEVAEPARGEHADDDQEDVERDEEALRPGPAEARSTGRDHGFQR
jgi:hypothetical protein